MPRKLLQSLYIQHIWDISCRTAIAGNSWILQGQGDIFPNFHESSGHVPEARRQGVHTFLGFVVAIMAECYHRISDGKTISRRRTNGKETGEHQWLILYCTYSQHDSVLLLSEKGRCRKSYTDILDDSNG